MSAFSKQAQGDKDNDEDKDEDEDEAGKGRVPAGTVAVINRDAFFSARQRVHALAT